MTGKRAAYNRGYREANHEKIRDQERAWLDARPLYSAVKRAKQRAKLMGLPFSLDDRTLAQPAFCPVLGFRLRYGTGNGVVGPDSPSLDRFIGELGYVPGNVRVISHRANTLKSDATIGEIEKVLAYMKWAG